MNPQNSDPASPLISLVLPVKNGMPHIQVTIEALRRQTYRNFEVLVQDSMLHGKTREEAEKMERENLGYFAGYYNRDTMRRVNRLFKTRHPMITPEMTEEEIFAIGKEVGRRLRR